MQINPILVDFQPLINTRRACWRTNVSYGEITLREFKIENFYAEHDYEVKIIDSPSVGGYPENAGCSRALITKIYQLIMEKRSEILNQERAEKEAEHRARLGLT